MATKQLEDRLALLCDDCGTEIFVNVNMVMIKDKLWNKIVDESAVESYCDCCIEKRLGRPIEVDDFKGSKTRNIVPCNGMWLWKNRREKYLEIFPEDRRFEK